MSHDTPPRLRDAGADPLLKNLLRAASDDRPTDAELAVVAAKLAPILGGAGGGSAAGGGGAPPAAGTSVLSGGALKMAAIGAASVALVAGGIFVARPSATPVVAPQPSSSSQPAPVVVAPPPVATPLAPVPVPVPLPSASVVAPAPAARPRPSASALAPLDDPDAEVKLLQRAQDALQTQPAEALALADAHARRAPQGLLAEEREVIAIDALVRLGRMTEARSRADRFSSRWPSSSHLTRVRTLIGAAN